MRAVLLLFVAVAWCAAGGVHGGVALTAAIEVRGNGFLIENGDFTPRYEDRTLFDRVVDTETNPYRILNTAPEGGPSLFITDITVTGIGFELAEPADTEVPASFDTLFSVRFTASAGGTFPGNVIISYTDGTLASTYFFNIRATVAEVNLVLVDDEYTMSWADELVVGPDEGLLANDLSRQGTLQLAATPVISGPAAFVAISLDTGAFTLNVTEPLFNGLITFNYTATNGFDTLSASVVVHVVDADSNVQCQDDVVLQAPTGSASSPVFYTVPTASFGAPVSQVEGPENGDVLTYAESPYEVVYEAAGLDGVSPSRCSFTIEITIEPPQIACPPSIVYEVHNACEATVELTPPFVTGYETSVTGLLRDAGIENRNDTGHELELSSHDEVPLGEHVAVLTVVDAIGQQDSCEYAVSAVLVPEEEEINQLAGYIDVDADGHGAPDFGCVIGVRNFDEYLANPNTTFLGVDGLLSAYNDDCNDLDPAVYPGHNEICDRKDNNCNGLVDEGRDCRKTGDRPLVAKPVHIPSLVSFAPMRTLPSPKFDEPDYEVPIVTESAAVRAASQWALAMAALLASALAATLL